MLKFVILFGMILEATGKGAPSATGAPVTSTTAPQISTKPCLDDLSYSQIRQTIREHITGLSDDREILDFIGGVVRLSFHDAAAFVKNGNSGGRADGCLDIQDGDNGGLEAVITELEPFYTQYESKVSRADFWVIVTNEALRHASVGPTCVNDADCWTGWWCSEKKHVCELSEEQPEKNFKYGRVDCLETNTPYNFTKVTTEIGALDHHKLPDAMKGWDHVAEVFVDRMGFTVEETIALMGAHTLGRCEADNSGFSGNWVSDDKAVLLDETYYRNLLFTPWFKSKNEFNDKFQWDQNTIAATDPAVEGVFMMLNTDMSLVVDDAERVNCTVFIPTGQAGATSAGCTNNATRANIVKSFIDSPDKWHKTFFRAMKKLQENGVLSTLATPGFKTDGTVCPSDEAAVIEMEKVLGKQPCWNNLCGDGYQCMALETNDYTCVETEQPNHLCQDSPGWNNNHGLTCGDYAREGCADNKINQGYEWMATHDYNSPSYHCCVCGRGKDSCRDTPGWTNGHGVKCDGMKNFCEDGRFKKGFEWMGKTKTSAIENNHPGYHCCVCGKGRDGCEDTPQWTNNHGLTCGNYEAEACNDGGFEKAFEYLGGTKQSEAAYNYPGHNCCKCGKGRGDGGSKKESAAIRPPAVTACVFFLFVGVHNWL